MLIELKNSNYPRFFYITYKIIKQYYPGEPFNILIRSLIDIFQENNRVITTKNGKGELTLFCVNGEQVNTSYARDQTVVRGCGYHAVAFLIKDSMLEV